MWPALLKPAFKATDLPQFPGSSRDVSLEVPLSIPNAEIEKALGKFKEPLLVDWACTDLFADPSGEKLAADKRAITYSFHYRSDTGTLKGKQVDAAHEALRTHLSSIKDVSLR